MKFDWLAPLRRRRPAVCRRNRRVRRPECGPSVPPPVVEALENRVLLSVTSITDTDIAFSTAGESIFKNEAVISKNFDYTFLNESFGTSFGGFTNPGGVGKTGVKVGLSADFELGLRGGLNIGSGTADVDYLTDVTVTAVGVGGSDINNLQFGDRFTVSVSDTPDDSGISMSTQMTAFDADLELITDVSAGLSVEAKFAGKSVIKEGLNWEIAPPAIEVVDIAADVNNGTLDFSVFGIDALELLNEAEFFNVVDNGVEFNLGPLEGGIYVPQLATGVDGDGFNDSNWNGTRILNKHLPVDLSQTVTRIDFLHAGFDAVEFIAGQVGALGIPTEFSELRLTDDLILEDFHLIDGIFSAHFGVAQRLKFVPELVVNLEFTDAAGAPKILYVENAPGSGVFEAVSSTQVPAGEDVEIIHTGGDLNISTEYILTGTFENETKLYITPTFDLNILDGKVIVDLNDFDKLDLFSNSDLLFNFDVTAFSRSFPFTNPIPIKTIAHQTLTFDSFASVDGSDLSISATPSTTFAVLAGLDRFVLEEGEQVTATVAISDPNARSDDGDRYDVTIDWGDGASESFIVDNSGSLPSHASYDALNHVLTVSHLYEEDTATQPDPRFPPDTFVKPISFTATKLTPGSGEVGVNDTAPGFVEVKNLPAELELVDLAIRDFGGTPNSAFLDIVYADPGVLDSHTLGIHWGDNAFTGFAIPDPGSLSVGQVIAANSGSEQLTVTSVDAATGTVGLQVTGHTYTQVVSGTLRVELVDDEKFGVMGFAQVPFGLDITSFSLPASVNENGNATLSAAFTANVTRIFGPEESNHHDVVIDWDDPHDTAEATFQLKKAHNLKVRDSFNSITDDSVLTITAITELAGGDSFDFDLSIEFEVVHHYVDDGAGFIDGGGGVLIPQPDTREVTLEIFENVFGPRKGASVTQPLLLVNLAPVVVLTPFEDAVSNGGVAILEGTIAEPGTLDTLTLDIDWGDGTSSSFPVVNQQTGIQGFTAGHIYASEGNYTITATATDDDGGVGTTTTVVTVDFEFPPTAVDDEVSTSEYESLTIHVLQDNGNGADTDPDGDLDPELTELTGDRSEPALGTIVDRGNGGIVFDPAGQFESLAHGETQVISFDYRIGDSLLNEDVGTVFVTVEGANDAPTVSAINAETNEDAGIYSLNLVDAGNADDVDATDILSVASITQVSGPEISYFRNGNHLEFDTAQFNHLSVGQSETLVFDFSVNDDSGQQNNSAGSQITLVVAGRNDNPEVTVQKSEVAVDEGQLVENRGSFHDVDLADIVAVSASLGTVSQDIGNDGAWTWSFDSADGPDESRTVTITAVDGRGESATTTFDLVIRNVAPDVVASQSSVVVDEGETATNKGTFSDPGVDAVTVTASIGTVDANPNGFWTWSFDTSDGPDESQTVIITATDSDGDSTSTAFGLTVVNVAPTIALSGASDVDEGAVYTLTLGAITDPGADTVGKYVVHWGDGTSNVYSAGGNVTHTFADDGLYKIAVDLIDEDGTHTVAGQINVTVNNVAPTIDGLTSSATFAAKALPGETVTISGTFSDAGVVDTHTLSVDWNDGSVTGTPDASVAIDEVGGTFTATHTYATGGLFTIAVTLTDDDRGADNAETSAVVTGVRVTDDGELQIIGTNGADSVSVKYLQRMGAVTDVNVETEFDGQPKTEYFFDPATVHSIEIHACDGDDTVVIQDQVAIDATIDGGAGNDELTGGGGNDVILGGEGNDIIVGGSGDDTISGGSGRNLIIGGIGADTLTGGSDGDLLIGGSTTFDDDSAALNLILDEWNSERSYEERVANISSGKGPILKGSKVALVASGSKRSVFDDGDVDTIIGGGDKDWFFASLSDGLLDRTADEFWDII